MKCAACGFESSIKTRLINDESWIVTFFAIYIGHLEEKLDCYICPKCGTVRVELEEE